MVVMVLLAVATTVLMGMLAAARPKSADSAAPPGNKHHNQRNPSHARSRLRWHRANHHHRSHHYPTTARQRTHCCTDIREEPEQVTKAAAVAAVQEETLSRPWVAAWRIAHLATAARMAAQALVGEHSVATETSMGPLGMAVEPGAAWAKEALVALRAALHQKSPAATMEV